MISALSHALSGIDSQVRLLEQAADRISRDGAQGDLVTTMVDLKRATHGVKANVASARAANEAVGSLLDVLG